MRCTTGNPYLWQPEPAKQPDHSLGTPSGCPTDWVHLSDRTSSDQRLSVDYWVTAFDKEYRTWAKDETPTFAAYIAKRLGEEILMDLEDIGGHQWKAV